MTTQPVTLRHGDPCPRCTVARVYASKKGRVKCERCCWTWPMEEKR